MTRPVRAVIPIFVASFFLIFITPSAFGEEDRIGAALCRARETYEKAMEAVRADVLDKIERDTVRFSAAADLDGVED